MTDLDLDRFAEGIPAAAVRLYHRIIEIEIEVEDALTDGMTFAQLLAHLDAPEAEAKAKATALAMHPKYLHVKAELGRALGLGPGDIHPLDLELDTDPVWNGPDDPRIPVWRRVLDLRCRLTMAHFDWMCWWQHQYPNGLRVLG